MGRRPGPVGVRELVRVPLADDGSEVAVPVAPARRRAVVPLERAAAATRPVATADEQLLAAHPALVHLLPGGGLRRGSVAAVAGVGAATSLALALAAGPSAAGSWVAAVGVPHLGVAAAVELGVDPGRLVVVAAPPPEVWASVVATAVDAFDVVLLGPAPRARAGDARRLVARTRERGSVLVLLGGLGQVVPDLCLTATAVAWEGVGLGHGHLRARRLVVEAQGRGRATRPRRGGLWLPDADGLVRADPSVPAGSRPVVAPLEEVG